jgi:ferredoxin
MKVVADRSKCVGAGQCVMAAPHLFSQGKDDGLVIVANLTPTEKEREAAELAVRSCPSLALTLKD